VQGAFARDVKQLRIEVNAGVHCDVVHVLQTTDDLHILGAGRDRVGRLVESLQAAAAQAVDRGASGRCRQPGEQAHNPANVETLFPLLLRAAEDDIFDDRWVDLRALNKRGNDGSGEIVGPHVAKHAALRMCSADRSAATVDDDGGFHSRKREIAD
jgi:hypothetical protein